LEHEFEHIDAGSRVLSVGAGGKINERLLEAAGRSGFSVTQLDIDSERSPDIEADLCEWCDEEAYDVVVMSEVLEHLHDPQAALANVRRSLRDEGKLVLTVPFLFPIHDEPYDYFRYTEHGLRMLL
jgi:2-polyprenyl-3-methyl-5-hydroxy-6-metoxy-1,4-benzoquinol methylase